MEEPIIIDSLALCLVLAVESPRGISLTPSKSNFVARNAKPTKVAAMPLSRAIPVQRLLNVVFLLVVSYFTRSPIAPPKLPPRHR